MAGEMLASAVVKEVAGKLGSAVWAELGLIWGLEKQLKDMESTFSTLEAVLEDAEKRSIKERSLRDWLKKLKDVAYEVDDLLDDFQTESPQQKPEVWNDMPKKVRYLFSSSNPIISRNVMGRRMNMITERLDKIAAERIKFHLKEEVVSDSSVEIRKRETFSEIDESTVYGRDDDREKIMKLLLEKTDGKEDISVIPIVGLAGIGKTTLAKLVFNDERVKGGHFDLRAWVYVSLDFDLKRLAGGIISAIGGKCDLLNLESMRNCLKGMLREKRYLFILDDVWNESTDEWDNLKLLLRGGMRGSKIIVTTRTEKVASITGTIKPYQLKCLSEEDCWALFKQRAFGRGGKEKNSNVVAIGRAIVKKCRGVPLAVNALGGIMSFKSGIYAWSYVRDSKIWELDENGDEVFSSLRLSYYHLPAPLKKCFAYCSIFPKGYEIDKDKLIQQWISQGFIRSNDGGLLLMEEVGNEYINNLLWMSFLQDLKKHDKSGRVICTMHDLVHDLAKSVAGDEVLLMDADKKAKSAKECRYASLIGYTEPSNIPTVMLEKVRALHFRGCGLMELPRHLFSPINCLRTLDLSGCWIEELPTSISKLRHLRYLDASNLPIQRLPESFGSLNNLQILNLSHCSFETLPKSIGNLLNL